MKARHIWPLALTTIFLTSCLSDGEDTIVLSESSTIGIPSDSSAGNAPAITAPTLTLPGITTAWGEENGMEYLTFTMSGLWDDVCGEWVTLYGTGNKGQNVWVTIDDVPKGVDVYNLSQESGRVIPTDVVFLVDNSASMDEEADAVAASIQEWVNTLTRKGISLRTGCVGYDEDGSISGALNLTDASSMKTYLDRTTGTGRTVGFDGPDASTLKKNSDDTALRASHECGMAALQFAHRYFSFREGANRVYINFTDEANQPGRTNTLCSVEWLNPLEGNWDTSYGTVHTVFSDAASSVDGEAPWKMSEYTGGTTIFTDPDFKGVTLNTLPVTGALSNSYLIRVGNVSQYTDGKSHLVKLTVMTTDRHVMAEKLFTITR